MKHLSNWMMALLPLYAMTAYANDAADTSTVNSSAAQGYTGAPISLEFADMPVRAVLDVLASFTGINIITDDSVTGNMTIRLTQVPWDQAFDVVMQMRNLSVLKNGNVWLVSSKSIQPNQPIITDYVRLNYAMASDIAALIMGQKTERGNINRSSRNENLHSILPTVRVQNSDEVITTSERGSLLSEKGTVTVDQRTNTLIIQDTAQSIANLRQMIAQLDIPVEQVMIEARIVSANQSFGRQLGARLGAQARIGNVQVGGSQNALWEARRLGAGGGEFHPDYQAVNLGVDNALGRIAFGLLNLPDGVLDLELSAMQAENKGEVISTPSVLTADKQMARISSGVQIPYQETTFSGATTTTFKEAALLLEATPSITPDGKIVLKLVIKNGNPVSTFGSIAIQEDAIETNVIVENGQTVVLGGIYRHSDQNQNNKVPLLGEIPVLGRLFRYDEKGNDKSELLIFITPKLLAAPPSQGKI